MMSSPLLRPTVLIRRFVLLLAAFASVAVSSITTARELPPAMLLLARPGMPDPNFAETVVLVSHREGAGQSGGYTIGVVLNRPSNESLASILPTEKFRRFTGPVGLGGPVVPQGLVALASADSAPGPAFEVLPGLWFTIAPQTVERLIDQPPKSLRFFLGHAGWTPGQLAAELLRGDWIVMRADADIPFTRDLGTLWRRLIDRASGVRADVDPASVARNEVTACMPPPSTASIAPVMNDVSAEASHRIDAAISSGRPQRRIRLGSAPFSTRSASLIPRTATRPPRCSACTWTDSM